MARASELSPSPRRPPATLGLVTDRLRYGPSRTRAWWGGPGTTGLRTSYCPAFSTTVVPLQFCGAVVPLFMFCPGLTSSGFNHSSPTLKTTTVIPLFSDGPKTKPAGPPAGGRPVHHPRSRPRPALPDPGVRTCHGPAGFRDARCIPPPIQNLRAVLDSAAEAARAAVPQASSSGGGDCTRRYCPAAARAARSRAAASPASSPPAAASATAAAARSRAVLPSSSRHQRTYVCACVRARIGVCVCAFVHACVRALVRVDAGMVCAHRDARVCAHRDARARARARVPKDWAPWELCAILEGTLVSPHKHNASLPGNLRATRKWNLDLSCIN